LRKKPRTRYLQVKAFLSGIPLTQASAEISQKNAATRDIRAPVSGTAAVPRRIRYAVRVFRYHATARLILAPCGLYPIGYDQPMA
jgi:hypothetical protein